MRFVECEGADIFKQDADILVNPVNCVGVMGKGLALDVKNRYPENFKAYALACKKKEVRLGEMHIFKNYIFYESPHPKWIVNFPTKDDWRNESDIRAVTSGLIDLVSGLKRVNVNSISIPALGCGLGRLDYTEVKKEIKDAFASLKGSNLIVYLFAPHKD